MSGSRKSLKSVARHFNPRAENDWSKDDSKFGQRMLEKMGWTKGQGIGRDNQGISENIKLRLKFDNKGLGFKIKDADHLSEIESNFAHLLSNLNQNISKRMEINDHSSESKSAKPKDNNNRKTVEHDKIINLNLSSEDGTGMSYKSENNKHRKTYKKKNRAKGIDEIDEIDEDVMENVPHINECIEQNALNELSGILFTMDDDERKKTLRNDEIVKENSAPIEVRPSNISFDCSEMIDLKFTNGGDEHTNTSRKRKKLKKNSESAEISSTSITSSICINQITSGKSNCNHKYIKKVNREKQPKHDSKSIEICLNDNVSSECSNLMIVNETNNDNHTKTFKKAKKKKKTSDFAEIPRGKETITDGCTKINVSEQTISDARLNAETGIETIITQYSLKRDGYDKREKNIEPNSEKINSKRKQKQKKSNLEEINCDAIINNIRTIDAWVDISDEFSEHNEMKGCKKKKKHNKMPDDQSSAKKEIEKLNIKEDELFNDYPYENKFGKEKRSKPSEAAGIPKNSSRLNLPSAWKVKENTACTNHGFAVDDRKLSKAERIVLKARLIKKLRNKTVVHDFDGSNLSGIGGYGNKVQKPYDC